jgi:hypothetical protein
MIGNFGNLPSVDHLKEGVHYRVVGWDFADSSPVSHTPGTPCPDGHKMVFGVCRKLKAGSQDVDRDAESEEEKAAKGQGLTPGGENKPVKVGEKKYGWALSNGKPIIVEWGSVAGIKSSDGSVTKMVRNPDGSVSTVKEPPKPNSTPSPKPPAQPTPKPQPKPARVSNIPPSEGTGKKGPSDIKAQKPTPKPQPKPAKLSKILPKNSLT